MSISRRLEHYKSSEVFEIDVSLKLFPLNPRVCVDLQYKFPSVLIEMTNNSIHHGHPSKGCLLSKILESGFFSGLNIVDELFVATDQLWWKKNSGKLQDV